MHTRYIVIFMFLFGTVNAQESSKLHFSSINQIGLLNGEQATSFSLQTVNGVRKNKWFAGAGIGIDDYLGRSIPVFVDLRYDLTTKENTPFMYTDGGINLLSETSGSAETPGYSTSAGIYYDLGVGWKLMFNNNRALLVSAGYSLKQVKENYRTYIGSPSPGLPDEGYDRFNYLYRRIVVKLGLQL